MGWRSAKNDGGGGGIVGYCVFLLFHYLHFSHTFISFPVFSSPFPLPHHLFRFSSTFVIAIILSSFPLSFPFPLNMFHSSSHIVIFLFSSPIFPHSFHSPAFPSLFCHGHSPLLSHLFLFILLLSTSSTPSTCLAIPLPSLPFFLPSPLLSFITKFLFSSLFFLPFLSPLFPSFFPLSSSSLLLNHSFFSFCHYPLLFPSIPSTDV